MAQVSLSTRITPGVDRRLRLLALVESKPLSHVLDHLLDKALPPVGDLTLRLSDADQPAVA